MKKTNDNKILFSVFAILAIVGLVAVISMSLNAQLHNSVITNPVLQVNPDELLSNSAGEAKKIFEKKGSVSRAFSSSEVSAGSLLEVSISIKLPSNSHYYFIEEQVPEGWIIVNNGGGYQADNKLKWAVIQGATSTTHTYTVKAPSTKGRHIFQGQYAYEGMNNPLQTQGRNKININ